MTGAGTQRPSTIYIEYDDPYSTPDYPEFDPAHRSRARNQMQVIGMNGLQGVRYNIISQADDFEIYDVVHDPTRDPNLALDPAMPDCSRQMKNRVLQLRRPDPARLGLTTTNWSRQFRFPRDSWR